jgi:hypothetical protein
VWRLRRDLLFESLAEAEWEALAGRSVSLFAPTVALLAFGGSLLSRAGVPLAAALALATGRAAHSVGHVVSIAVLLASGTVDRSAT